MTTDEFWKYWEEHCSTDMTNSRLILGFSDGFVLQVTRSNDRVYSYNVHDQVVADEEKVKELIVKINHGTAATRPNCL